MVGWLDTLKDKQEKKVSVRALSSVFIKSKVNDDVFVIVGASTSVSEGLNYRILSLQTRKVIRISEASLGDKYKFI